MSCIFRNTETGMDMLCYIEDRRCMISDHAGPPAAILSCGAESCPEKGCAALVTITVPPLLLVFAWRRFYSFHLALMISSHS